MINRIKTAKPANIATTGRPAVPRPGTLPAPAAEGPRTGFMYIPKAWEMLGLAAKGMDTGDFNSMALAAERQGKYYVEYIDSNGHTQIVSFCKTGTQRHVNVEELRTYADDFEAKERILDTQRLVALETAVEMCFLHPENIAGFLEEHGIERTTLPWRAEPFVDRNGLETAMVADPLISSLQGLNPETLRSEYLTAQLAVAEAKRKGLGANVTADELEQLFMRAGTKRSFEWPEAKVKINFFWKINAKGIFVAHLNRKDFLVAIEALRNGGKPVGHDKPGERELETKIKAIAGFLGANRITDPAYSNTDLKRNFREAVQQIQNQHALGKPNLLGNLLEIIEGLVGQARKQRDLKQKDALLIRINNLAITTKATGNIPKDY